MPTEKPKQDTDTTGKITKLTLPDGFRVGILNLDNILKEVADLNLTNTQAIQKELLERVKAQNYVARGAESEYALALFQEYQKKYGKSEEVQVFYNPEIHRHTAG